MKAKMRGDWFADQTSSSGGYILMGWDWGILGPIAKLLWWLLKFVWGLIFRR
jgi:hypothetical protein